MPRIATLIRKGFAMIRLPVAPPPVAAALLCAVLAVPACAGTAVAVPPADPSEVAVTTASRTALGITIYNDGQALVRDTRQLSLGRGLDRIAFRDVAATMRPETAALRAVSGAGFTLVEQNFDFDLLTPAALLSKYVGREVTVIRTNPTSGEDSAEKATVLAGQEGVVLRYRDRIETGVPGRIAFGDVPANLRDRPTLSMLLDAPREGAQQAELTYLANEIGWKADYVANLAADGQHMQLNGWVTLTNKSGTAYDNARLQLVAGSLNRVRERNELQPQARAKLAMAANAAAPMSEEKLGDYHLYTLAHPTTILNNQTKQVALMSAGNIPVQREYLLEPGAAYGWYQAPHPDVQKGLKPSALLHFDNRGGDLGIPLPAGTVRVYVRDSGDAAQFVGEDAIVHTAKGEKLALRLGEAFDITADRIQTDFRLLGKRSSQSSYRIEIRNADPRPVTVTVREPLQGDWNIPAENLPHVKESSGAATWKVAVPGSGSATLEYTAVVQW